LVRSEIRTRSFPASAAHASGIIVFLGSYECRLSNLWITKIEPNIIATIVIATKIESIRFWSRITPAATKPPVNPTAVFSKLFGS